MTFSYALTDLPCKRASRRRRVTWASRRSIDSTVVGINSII